ncbi:hypothetical protein F8S13_04660 [Chloroflexia bacterium SDU3-3]|nr:hypothetical protein F8S13_04660 [Chloroflexia bacterium SDU3-3]
MNSNQNTLINNYIGVSLGASASLEPVKNNGFGIQLENSAQNAIGNLTSGGINVISANGLSGIQLTGTQTYSNTLSGNYIGTNENGVPATGLGNLGDGIRLTAGARQNTIRGTASARTVIASNQGYGVLLTDNGTTGNKIIGSYIGISLSGSASAPNAQGGIRVQDNASNTVIGTATTGEGNVISGNTKYGISISRTVSTYKNTDGTTVQGNKIGLNAAESAALANTLGGIYVDAGVKNTLIGGSTTGQGNVIAGNGGAGVLLSGSQVLTATLQGNIIGLGKATSGANQGKYAVKIANSGDGVQINNAVGTVVGGSTAAAGNTIAGNGKNGIRISGTGTTTTTLRYNTLGTTKPSTDYLSGLGNTENGVLIDASSGPVEIRNSAIYSNTLSGVRVTGTPQRVFIQDNSFTGNGQGKTGDDAKAIALESTTVGGSEVATKPNHDIDPPYNMALNEKRLVTGRVRIDKLSPSACITCTLQFFAANPSTLDGEGRDAIATVGPVAIDTSGYFTTTLATLPAQLAVTATDYRGNTSEFSVLTVSPAVDIEVIGASSLLAGPSEPVTYTLRVTNVGTLDLTDLQLVAKSDKGWEPVLNPEALSLKGTGQNGGVGESKPVTLTMTLPEGTDPRVRIPTTDTTYITVTSALIPDATDSTSVSTEVTSKFVLKVTPRSTTGSGVTLNPPPAKPTTVPYNITLLNTGNLTGTVTIVATTSTIDGNFAEWETTLTTDTVTLTPGIAKTPAVNVSIPYEAAAGTQAKTTIVISSPLLLEPVTITTTTTVAQDQRATIGYDDSGEGKAGQITTFTHEVQNIGNTAATFKLDAGSSIGSTVAFRSLTPGITIAADGTFTLDTTNNRILRFAADVTVSSQAYRGDKDIVSITLYDESNSSIGGVQDTITVTQSAVVPRMYLPFVVR